MGWFGRRDNGSNGPDYSQVDSMEKAQQLAARGDLVPVLLLPEQFGGQAIPPNIVYVPAFAAELKEGTEDNIVRPMAEEGKVTRYSAEPEYEGNSFVPVAIKLTASDPGSFTYNLGIWGSGLSGP